MDVDKVSLIENNRDRLRRDYGVYLEYGLKATDGVSPKQWIAIGGSVEDRHYAKVRMNVTVVKKVCVCPKKLEKSGLGHKLKRKKKPVGYKDVGLCEEVLKTTLIYFLDHLVLFVESCCRK